MAFLGMYRHARTAHVQAITQETFISLGANALSGGDVCTQGGVIALADGEIRNRNQLCRILKLSYDTPASGVILRAYRTWGADFPRRIEGAVMTAIIDRVEDRMIVSRDRMGAVPVYYAWRLRSVAFASSANLLMLAGAAGRMVNRDGILEILAMGGVHTPGKTPFRDIRMLEPGCVLIADARGSRIRRYYSIVQAAEAVKEAGSEELKKAFLQAAGEISKCASGVLLGFSDLDEALLTALQKSCTEAPKGFFLDAEGEEAEYIRSIGAVPEGIKIDPGALFEALEDVSHVSGFPGYRIQDAMFLMVLKTVKESAKSLAMPLLEGCDFSNGDALPWAEGERGLTYIKKEVREILNADRYVNDRRHEMLDRLMFSCDTDDMEREMLSAAQWALSALPAIGEKRRTMAESMSISLVSPMFDERVAQALIVCGSSGVRAMIPDAPQSPLNECKRCRLEHLIPAAFEKRVYEEAMRVASDEMQPVFRLIDSDKVRRHIRGGCADAGALSEILQLNWFLSETEADIDF